MNIHVMQALHQLLGVKPSVPSRGFYRAPNGVPYINGQRYPEDTAEDNPGNPDMMPLHMGQAYRGSLGTADGGNSQNAGPPQLQGAGMRYQLPQIQGRFNPGQIPLQQSNIRYRQGPQPTQPWYDF